MPSDRHRRHLRQQVEDFLYTEAALLDAWRLDDWLLLFDDDAKYEVPCNDAVDGDPSQDLMLIDDNYARLARQGRTAQQPTRPPRVPAFAHQPPGVQRAGRRLGADELSVSASFTVWRFRAGRSSCYVGRYRYRLRPNQRRFPDRLQEGGIGHDGPA